MLRITCWMVCLLTSATQLVPGVAAQEPAPSQTTSAKPDLAPTESVPIWARPTSDAKSELGRMARALEPAVFVVAFPKLGHGTAWVISKKHRLLVTNAHVADIFHEAGGKMLAVPSGTDQIYRVAKAWYHPGVRRYLKGASSLSVRAPDPKEGDIDPQSPDLALLQLAPGGPDLPAEFTPATEQELKSLFAQPAAIIGFPGHDSSGLPRLGENAASTFHDGVISRVTDFNLRASSNPGELQFLQYTMSTWNGFSGSPVILPSGRVAAVHNMARYASKEWENDAREVRSIPHGVRVDCVLEMLVHHKLEDQVPFPVDKSKLNVQRWIEPDARTEKARADYAKAEALVAEASNLLSQQKFLEIEEKCNEALKIVPDFGYAYLYRAYATSNFAATTTKQISKSDKHNLLKQSLSDLKMFMKQVPSDLEGPVFYCMTRINIGILMDSPTDMEVVIQQLNRLAGVDGLSEHDKAGIHSYRAAANNFAGNKKAALADHNEALRLNPDAPTLWDNRARYWQENRRLDLAAADQAKADELRAIRGLEIRELDPDGPAASAGLVVGDVIFNVDTVDVRTAASLSSVLSKAKGSVEVRYISATTGKNVNQVVQPRDGTIGITVAPVPYK